MFSLVLINHWKLPQILSYFIGYFIFHPSCYPMNTYPYSSYIMHVLNTLLILAFHLRLSNVCIFYTFLMLWFLLVPYGSYAFRYSFVTKISVTKMSLYILHPLSKYIDFLSDHCSFTLRDNAPTNWATLARATVLTCLKQKLIWASNVQPFIINSPTLKFPVIQSCTFLRFCYIWLQQQ